MAKDPIRQRLLHELATRTGIPGTEIWSALRHFIVDQEIRRTVVATAMSKTEPAHKVVERLRAIVDDKRVRRLFAPKKPKVARSRVKNIADIERVLAEKFVELEKAIDRLEHAITVRQLAEIPDAVVSSMRLRARDLWGLVARLNKQYDVEYRVIARLLLHPPPREGPLPAPFCVTAEDRAHERTDIESMKHAEDRIRGYLKSKVSAEFPDIGVVTSQKSHRVREE